MRALKARERRPDSEHLEKMSPGLFSERDAAYLMRFDDGLLRETRVFESVEDAIDVHRQGGPQPS
jgi:hypothetical protein